MTKEMYPKKKDKLPLSKTHPKLAKEADGWDPDKYHAESYSIRAWVCNKGHQYSSDIISRTKKNNNCPYCSGHRTLKGFNDLATTHSELASQIKEGDPTKYSAGSDQKFLWICSKGHTWRTSISNRALRGTNCPECHKLKPKIYSGDSNLQIKYPEIAVEAYGWDPSLVSAGSEKTLEWKCPIGHIYNAKPFRRTKFKQECTVCSGKTIVKGFNDLATINPMIASEMINGDPTKISRASQKKFLWECKKKHQWTATVANRVNRGSGCPVCAGKKVVTGENDLETLHPTIALQAYGWNPSQVRPGSHKKLKWKCTNGHVFTSSPESRLKEKNEGCKICLKSELLIGFNDLYTTHLEVAMEASGWNPRNVFSGDTKKRNWMCEFGHQWLATPSARTRIRSGSQGKNKGSGCHVCAGKKVVAGVNDLATLKPSIAEQAAGWDPKKFTLNSNKRKKWICSLGHQWMASIANRTKQELGCPYCSNQRVLSGFNDLATIEPKLAREAYGWDPKTVTRGSDQKRKWKCSEGHIWSANIANRSGRGDGCPTCNAHGFDPNENAWLYLLKHENWKMLQIGITNYPDDRTKSHKKLGWQIIELRGPSDGHSTQKWETSILRMLKAKGADLSNSKIAGKFDGYSEAWSESTFPIKSIKELMQLTEEFEEN
jgi:hypothetical protein